MLRVNKETIMSQFILFADIAGDLAQTAKETAEKFGFDWAHFGLDRFEWGHSANPSQSDFWLKPNRSQFKKIFIIFLKMSYTALVVAKRGGKCIHISEVLK